MKINFVLVLSLLLICSCTQESSLETTEEQVMRQGLPVVVQRAEFDRLVASNIVLLKQMPISDFTDRQQVELMRLSNTIGFHHNRFHSGQYQQLEALLKQKDYYKKIIEVYPNWIPSRGMGFYFTQLKMELGGTPRSSSLYEVID
jgi:hypothetical protein